MVAEPRETQLTWDPAWSTLLHTSWEGTTKQVASAGTEPEECSGTRDISDCLSAEASGSANVGSSH